MKTFFFLFKDDLESVTSEKETVLVGPELGDRHARLQPVSDNEPDLVKFSRISLYTIITISIRADRPEETV